MGRPSEALGAKPADACPLHYVQGDSGPAVLSIYLARLGSSQCPGIHDHHSPAKPPWAASHSAPWTGGSSHWPGTHTQPASGAVMASPSKFQNPGTQTAFGEWAPALRSGLRAGAASGVLAR